MKKKTPLIFLLATLSAAAIGVVGCGNSDNGKTDHVHSYTEWKYDENGHWKECPDDHEKDASSEGAHVDADGNGKCDDCGYVIPAPHEHSYTEWKYDENGHWKECPDDGVKDASSQGTHVDADENGKCDDCGYVIPAQGHTHSYTEWKYDEDNHWKECPDDGAKDVSSQGAHVDADKDGECDDCGYEVGIVEDDARENTISFAIDVDEYDGEGVADKKVKTGASFIFPEAPSIEYYEFDYWKLGENHYAVGDSYKVEADGDLAFTAVYAETYVLTYSVAEGLTAPASQSGRVGAEIDLAEGADNGYSVFANWVIGGQNYASGAKFTPVHGANVATAAYTGTYVVSFEVEEGLTAPEAKSGNVGGTIVLPEAPDKADYDFEGWLIGDELYQAGDEYEPAFGATTATAQYKLAYIYVTFAKDEGVEGDLPAEAVRVRIDSELDAEDLPELNVAEFHAVVWYNGEEVVTEFKFSENVTLTAKSEYVGTVADAFIFVEVKDGDDVVAYTVMAGDNFADYLSNGRLGLPVSYNGKPVTGITAGSQNENAFGGSAAAGLQYVYIPASYTTIGSYAFSANTSLTTVVYGEGSQLETIGMAAFYQDTALATFGISAEQNGIYIPASVKTLSGYAFFGVSINGRVLNVYFAESNAQLTSIGDYAFAAKTSGNVTAAQRGGIILQTAIPETVTTIGGWAFFANPVNYIDFGVESQLESIGDHAFSMMSLGNTDTTINNASEVEEIIIPKSVTSIGEHAFRNHINVEKIEFEAGSALTEIKQYTFWQMPKLKTLVLPANLTTIGQYAFANSFDGTVNFGGEGGLFSGLTDIPTQAFNGANFNKVIIGKNVTNIQSNAFYGASIKELEFEKGGTAELVLGNSAFQGIKGAIAVEIPARVKTIPQGIFYQANITALTFEAGDEDLTIANGAFNAFGANATAKTSTSTSDTAYPFTATEIVFPARLVAIGECAFQGQIYLKDISFAENSKLESIAKNAFAYTVALEGVILPDSLVTIGDYAFASYWTFFKYTVMGESAVTLTYDNFGEITSLTIPAKVATIGQYGFYNRGIALEELEFEGTAQNADLTIGTAAFAIHGSYVTAAGKEGGNTKLTSVKFPANLVSLAGIFFINSSDNYSNLATLDISDCAKLTSLDNNFGAYSAVTSFVVPANITTIGTGVFMASKLTSLTFAEGSKLTTIGENAFSNNMAANGTVSANSVKLTTVTIPASVTSIGAKAFAGISTLTAINVAEGSESFKSVEGVLFSFDGKTLVNYPYGKTGESYRVPDGVTNIADHAFTGNPNLTSIDFNGVKVIEGTYGFTGVKLTTVSHTFESVGNYTFSATAVANSTLLTVNIDITGTTAKPTNLFLNCATLTEATLGAGFGDTIPGNMFQNCSALTTVNLPTTITKVGSNAFRGTAIVLTQAQADQFVQLDGSAFYDVKTELIKDSNGVVSFANVTTLGTNVFQNNNVITSVTLPKVTALTNYLFSGCSNLITVNAPLATTIGQQTFANCAALGSVTVGDITKIDTQAFNGCTSLGSLTLSGAEMATLSNINAFTNCHVTVYVPESLLATYEANATWASAVAAGTVTFATISVEDDDDGEDGDDGDEDGADDAGAQD